jgi:hypothetical protein
MRRDWINHLGSGLVWQSHVMSALAPRKRVPAPMTQPELVIKSVMEQRLVLRVINLTEPGGYRRARAVARSARSARSARMCSSTSTATTAAPQPSRPCKSAPAEDGSMPADIPDCFSSTCRRCQRARRSLSSRAARTVVAKLARSVARSVSTWAAA